MPAGPEKVYMSVARKLIVIPVRWRSFLDSTRSSSTASATSDQSEYARIVNLIGINITLAVSLNLINGLADGSIGHAGSWRSAAIADHLTEGRLQPRPAARSPAASALVVMVLSLLGGAFSGAHAGLVVGIPSLRPQGRLSSRS